MDPPTTTVAKVLDYQARQVTYNVYTYYKTQKMDPSTPEYKDDVNIIDMVAKVTGLSKSTVTRIIRDGNAMKQEKGEACFKPQEKRKHVRKKRIEVDENTEGIIRRKVIQFYTVKKEVPSVRKLNILLKKQNILQCSHEYLRQLLHKLGFTNADGESTEMMMERPDIALDRLKYLQVIKIFRDQNCNIFFFSETDYWPVDDERENMPSIIMVHASGAQGFLDGQMVMIRPKPKKGTCNVAAYHFQEYSWVKDKVLPNIPQKSVIVMDAPYRGDLDPEEAIPKSQATRGAMQNWLNKHKVPFKQTAKKTTLVETIKIESAKDKLRLTDMFKHNGHSFIHLPQKHADLNPSRMAWEDFKKSGKNLSPVTFFSKYPEKKWKAWFDRVAENEKEYFEHDMKIDEALDSLKAIKEEKEDSENEIEIEEHPLAETDADEDCSEEDICLKSDEEDEE